MKNTLSTIEKAKMNQNYYDLDISDYRHNGTSPLRVESKISNKIVIIIIIKVLKILQIAE